MTDYTQIKLDIADGIATLTLARAEMDFRLRLDPFEVDLGRLWIDDPQVPLRLSGRLSATGDAWAYALDGEFGQVTPEALMRVWPPVRSSAMCWIWPWPSAAVTSAWPHSWMAMRRVIMGSSSAPKAACCCVNRVRNRSSA